MRSKKPKLITEFKCDHCNTTTSSFVTTASYKHFCRIQTPGKPADKDCMSDYIQSKRYPMFGNTPSQISKKKQINFDI